MYNVWFLSAIEPSFLLLERCALSRHIVIDIISIFVFGFFVCVAGCRERYTPLPKSEHALCTSKYIICLCFTVENNGKKSSRNSTHCDVMKRGKEKKNRQFARNEKQMKKKKKTPATTTGQTSNDVKNMYMVQVFKYLTKTNVNSSI